MAKEEKSAKPLLSRYALAALIVFMVSAAVAFTLGRNERSPWIRITQPVEHSYALNPLIGYSDFWGAIPFHRENESFVYQITMLYAGNRSHYDVYFTRPVYSFIASFLAPFIGIIPALSLTNLLCWACAALIAWHFTRLLFDNELAAMFAVIFVSAGTGFIVHIGDYSAHLMSFTFYYLGILVLYKSKMWCSKKPLIDHVKMGLFLSICCLQYNSGLYLVLAYFLLSIRHNSPRHVLPAAAIAVLSQRLWVCYLNLPVLALHHPYINLYDLENWYFADSIQKWLKAAATPWGLLHDAVSLSVSFFSVDYLPVIIAGCISCFIYFRRRSLLTFAILLVFLPVLSGMVFAQTATARGYLIFGSSILVFASLGAGLAGLIGKSGRYKPILIPLVFLFIASYYIWSFSCLSFNSAPAKTYLEGILSTRSMFKHGPPEVMSLTGEEFTPRLMGGTHSISEAGLRSEYPTEPSYDYSLLFRMGLSGFFRLFLSLFFIALLVLLFPRVFYSWKRVGVVILLFYVAPSIILPLTIRKPPAFVNYFHTIPDGWNEKLARYKFTVRLSDRFIQLLKKEITPEMRVELFTGLRGDAEPSIFIGDKRLPLNINREFSRKGVFHVTKSEIFRDYLEGSNFLTVEFESNSWAYIASWQRSGLAGRTFTRDEVPVSSKDFNALPVFEIRLWRADGTLAVAGF